MNIHDIVTLAILLLVASLVTAQFSWDNAFGYRRRVDYDPPSHRIEIRPTRIIKFVDDDYTHSLRHFHLFEPFDPPQPVVYLPRIHFTPEVHVEERYPYAYNRFDVPVAYNNRFDGPFLTRLLTTLSVSYKTKILPVVDYDDENKETVTDSLPSDTNSVVKAVTSSDNESKATEKDSNVGKNTTAKPTSPKPTVKVESVTKPEVEKKTEAEKKPEVATKPESDKKIETTTTTKEKTTEVSETNVDETTKPAEEEVKKSDAESPATETDASKTEKSEVDAKGETVPTENSDGAATETEVPAA